MGVGTNISSTSSTTLAPSTSTSITGVVDDTRGTASTDTMEVIFLLEPDGGPAFEFINVCDPGLVCLISSTVPPGQACEGAGGCCTEVCDITDPAGDLQCTGAAGGQQCLRWYQEGMAPAGLENVGACAVPA